MRVYHVTEAGRATHMDWLRQPVDPATIVNDLGLHLMRFALMENQAENAAVLAFLADLAGALKSAISGMEYHLAQQELASRRHGTLALQHGIAVHRASLDWAEATMAALAGPVRANPGPAR